MKLVDFLDVKLEVATARSEKRLAIHLAERGIRTRSAGPAAGYTSTETRRRMQNPKNEGEFRMYHGASANVSLDSEHVKGDAFDAVYRVQDYGLFQKKVPKTWRNRIAVDPHALYDYAEHIAAAYKIPLDRPLYPKNQNERNHFVLVHGHRVLPLSPAALVRWRRAAKL